MLKEVTKFVWNETIESRKVSVFNSIAYLELISSLHKTQLKFWLIYNQKNKPIIGFATHIKYKCIVIPDHYGYSSFWKDTELGGFSFFDYLDKALKNLKYTYKSIQFRLPPEIADIRAFNSNGFKSHANFTYLKDPKSVNNYRNNILEKLKFSNKEGFLFLYNENHEDVLAQQISDFKYFNFTDSKIDFYKTYFQRLIKSGMMRSFLVYKNKELIASALAIVDFNTNTAYNILLSSSKKNYGSGVNAFLYDNMMKKLSEIGIETFDLYGADMKGIANFKSGFSGELVPHYTVSCSAIDGFRKTILFNVKKAVKRLYNWVYKCLSLHNFNDNKIQTFL